MKMSKAEQVDYLATMCAESFAKSKELSYAFCDCMDKQHSNPMTFIFATRLILDSLEKDSPIAFKITSKIANESMDEFLGMIKKKAEDQHESVANTEPN